jgi:hypothetical protein
MGYAHNETSGQQNRCGQVSKPYNYQRTKREEKLSLVSPKCRILISSLCLRASVVIMRAEH